MEKKEAGAEAGFFISERYGLAALLGATALLGAAALLGATLLRATALRAALLRTATLLCSHGNLSNKECGTLGRSPGGSARRRPDAEALWPSLHAPPEKCAKSEDSYIKTATFRATNMRMYDDADRARASAPRTGGDAIIRGQYRLS